MTDEERAREWLDENGPTSKFDEAMLPSLTKLLSTIRAEERERCAKMCDLIGYEFDANHMPEAERGAYRCSCRIREMGEP